jgi:hypothetical protein
MAVQHTPIPLQLMPDDAWALAQLAKRLGWQELRGNAVDDAEAYAMRDAVCQLQQALRDAGFAPR